VVCWDNFDYNQTVRHQTLRDPSKHVCATTGKLSIGHYIPKGGLKRSMFRPEIPLSTKDVYDAPGTQIDDISIQCQRFWIAEAIRYTHKTAVDTIFASEPSTVSYPQFPTVERLKSRITPNFGLGPILENEGTIQGTYQVIDKIFLHQLGLDPADIDFKDRLFPIYGDQKTVSLIGSVKRERKDSRNNYGRYQ
jgi:hypothetical protein